MENERIDLTIYLTTMRFYDLSVKKKIKLKIRCKYLNFNQFMRKSNQGQGGYEPLSTIAYKNHTLRKKTPI